MAEERKMVTVYIMGEAYQVPESSTIIGAIEYAGFQLKKGVGCREGFCGACGTVYREKGEYKLQGGLGCQTVVSDGMYIAQMPFVPSEKPIYDIDEIEPNLETFTELYPEIFRCMACNSCTKICPQDIQVMDYIQAIKRGDIAEAADISFDCIRCGLCAIRCPAEITQFNTAILSQRLYGKYLSPKHPHLKERVEEIKSGKFDKDLEELSKLDRKELARRYYGREIKVS